MAVVWCDVVMFIQALICDEIKQFQHRLACARDAAPLPVPPCIKKWLKQVSPEESEDTHVISTECNSRLWCKTMYYTFKESIVAHC